MRMSVFRHGLTKTRTRTEAFQRQTELKKRPRWFFFLIFFQWWRQSPKNEGSWGTGKKEFSLKPDKMSSESRERKLKVCGRVKQPLSVPNFFYFPGNLLRLFRSHKRIIIKLIPQVKSLSGLLWRKKCTWPFFLNLCQLCSTALCKIGDQENSNFNFAA